jgi:hypothetical protein
MNFISAIRAMFIVSENGESYECKQKISCW